MLKMHLAVNNRHNQFMDKPLVVPMLRRLLPRCSTPRFTIATAFTFHDIGRGDMCVSFDAGHLFAGRNCA